MNIDKTIAALEVGYQNPVTMLYKTQVEDQYMEPLKVRRRVANATHHTLWCFSIGEAGTQPFAYYDHRPAGAIKKAMAAKGLPTITRGPRKQAPSNGQAQPTG